jgi:transketolase
MFDSPYEIALKPYGIALLELAKANPNIFCLGADLTRQTETDLIRDELPNRFINVGMAEANMVGIAGGMARAGKIVFINSFGVFTTRRCYDQIAMAVAYPNLNVKIVGFMPGISSPGGPSHQAIDDIALMRALPNMTVVDLADAEEITQAVTAVAEHQGPVYLRLKRGEIPIIFDKNHQFSLHKAHHLIQGSDGCVIASGMMVPAAISAVKTLSEAGLNLSFVNCPVIKPLDKETILSAIGTKKFVMTVENHSVIGGLGSAVAEAMAEKGLGVPLIRLGLQDTFAESGSREFLFEKYQLGVQKLIDSAWAKSGLNGKPPQAPPQQIITGKYAPV